MKKRILQFSVLALLLVVACGIPISVVGAASGTLSANSQYIYIPSGLGSVTITWDTSGCATAQVYVCMDNKNEILWAQNPDGSGVADWIQAGHDYVFKLYAGTDRTELLETVNVIGFGTNGGTVAARETEVIIPAGQSLGTAEITFGANGYATNQIYVKMDNNAEQLWGESPYGTATATWIQANHKYQFNLYASTSHTTLLDSVTVYGRKYTYDVGVNYHGTGADWDATGFLREYHISSVRNTVLAQLQGMANAGATVLKTYIPMVVLSGTPTEKWKLHFPPTAQEFANIRQYAQDVAAIQASDGHRLKMTFFMGWFWDASYEIGSPATGLGHAGLSESQFNTYVVSAYQGLLNNVYDIYRPDGQKVAERVYLAGEVMITVKANAPWFFSTHYGNFVSYCNARGVTPTLYFITLPMEADVLDGSFTDYSYPIVSGHKSMYYVYRSLRYLYDNNLPIPDRIDMSMYIYKDNSTYETLCTHMLDDAEATLTSLGARKYFGCVETHYFDPTSYQGNVDREALGAAFAVERLRNDRLACTIFWTTPPPCDEYGNPRYPAAGYPFQVEDYLP